MSLIHFANAPLPAELDSRPQDPAGSYKPKGLWVSVEGEGGGWRDWCIGEGYGLDSLTYAHHVTLADDARILYVDGAEGIDEFTATYSGPDTLFGGEFGYRIDWPRIAREYQGIIIAPYIWSRRLSLHTHWYYGWDCASGCIWDATAIANVELTSEQLTIPITGD